MKKNLSLLFAAAFFLGTSASIFAAEIESGGGLNISTTAVGLKPDLSAVDFIYTIQAVNGATVIVPVNTVNNMYIMSATWMLGEKVGNSVRYVFDYDEWVRGGKPNVFEGSIIGTDNKTYKVQIQIL